MCKHSWFLLATLIGAERRPDCWADQEEQRQAPEERWGGDEKAEWKGCRSSKCAESVIMTIFVIMMKLEQEVTGVR